MAHIQLPEGLPGIRGPMVFSPETTRPLCDLVQVLLTGPHTLTPAEREMIATYVSSQNDCIYCQSCHGSTAAQHLGGSDADYELIAQIKQNYQATPISAKMKALLAIAGNVQKGGKHVTPEDINRARQVGATDKEIHDTVLIAAHFACSTAMSTGWPRGSRAIPRFIAKSESKLLNWVTRDATTKSRCRQSRMHKSKWKPDSKKTRFRRTGDPSWRTFDSQKAFPESLVQWLSVLKRQNRSTLWRKCFSARRTVCLPRTAK